jgi:hypothetical protein
MATARSISTSSHVHWIHPERDDPSVLQEWMHQGGRRGDYITHKGMTCMIGHAAAMANHPRLLTAWAKRPHQSAESRLVMSRTHDGLTIGHVAAIHGSAVAMHAWITLGGKVSMKDADGQTVADTAAHYGHHETFAIAITQDPAALTRPSILCSRSGDRAMLTSWMDAGGNVMDIAGPMPGYGVGDINTVFSRARNMSPCMLVNRAAWAMAHGQWNDACHADVQSSLHNPTACRLAMAITSSWKHVMDLVRWAEAMTVPKRL